MPADEKAYQRQKMLHEYDTLRAEILQCYEQQVRLVFGAAVTAAAVVTVSLVDAPTMILGLPALLILLIGVCNKSVANYSRIYRIGSYLAVVHEQRGGPTDSVDPGPDTAAWHTRWRQAARAKSVTRTGGSGARAEAWFLLLLGVAGWALIGGNAREQFLDGFYAIVVLSLSIVLSLILLYFWVQLRQVFDDSKHYEVAFRAAVTASVDPPEEPTGE